MELQVNLAQTGPRDAPSVVLSTADATLVLRWPVWEMLVHRASHLYVAWALTHGNEWLSTDRALYGVDQVDVVDARARVLEG